MEYLLKTCAIFLLATTLSACGGGETYDAGSSVSQTNPASDNAPNSDNVPAEPVPTEPALIDLVRTEPTLQNTSIMLSWMAPATYTDDTLMPLDEIGGYKIYYGTAYGPYDNIIDIPDNTAESFIITGLPSGTYVFTVVTYDVHGIHSAYAEELTIEI